MPPTDASSTTCSCHWQMQATEVDGGQAALTMLAQARDQGAPFPLVLLDAHMPEMDGFTVAARDQGRSHLG